VPIAAKGGEKPGILDTAIRALYSSWEMAKLLKKKSAKTPKMPKSAGDGTPATKSDAAKRARFFHPWHDVRLGDNIEKFFYSIIEIPKGCKNKYELHKETGLLFLDRVLHSAVYYPANYGFLPRTYCDDGDPLDVLVLGQEPVAPLCIVRARAIGVLTMMDEKGRDDKIIAVHVDDPEFAHYSDISQLPPHRVKELKRFFEDYKSLEHKLVEIDSIRGRLDAEHCIREAIQLYADNFA
jgi:inorganic pyrophosphatase